MNQAHETLLALRGINKAFFGVKAVNEVTLDVPRGEILGLIGENGAGKSTLMNVIGGVVRVDSGEMLLDGQPYAPTRPSDATDNGIAFIHQELNLFTNLTIAENIFINSFPKRQLGPLAFIDRGALKQRTSNLLAMVDLDLAPDTPVDRISPGERQLVEIAKALNESARLIIFDEPTTSLTTRETRKLFEIMNRLRSQGVTMIYISHILNDVKAIADSIAVMRDGDLIAHERSEDFTINRMISLMVGRDIEQLYPPHEAQPQEGHALNVRGVSQPGIVKDINFDLRWGEVLGMFGLMGSGRTELARIVFGMDDYAEGSIAVDGSQIDNASPRESLRNRLAFVTENRREEGLMMNLNIMDNISLCSLREFANDYVQVVDQRQVRDSTRRMVDAMRIKTGAVDQATAKSLSGGNQQKVVIAKWLMTNPAVFIMDEPTRGIDVGAKYEIYALIDRLAADGSSVLFISSELDELMAMCDRILVMSQGEIVGEFARADFDKETILRAAFRELTPAGHVRARDNGAAGATSTATPAAEGSIEA